MKILLFTDVHADKESLEKILEKSKDCDVMLCCGDISVFGSGLKRTMQTLRKSGKKMFLTHGNHEMITELKDLCDGKLDIFLHKEFVKFEDVTFIAYGGGGFSERDERLDSWIKSLKGKIRGKTIFFTHAPPYGTKLDKLPYLGYRGSKSVREAIETLEPDLFVSGHFHETFLKKDKIGNTLLINPGPGGTLLEI
jgi:Icc-related predicted phosphoesterase